MKSKSNLPMEIDSCLGHKRTDLDEPLSHSSVADAVAPWGHRSCGLSTSCTRIADIMPVEGVRMQPPGLKCRAGSSPESEIQRHGFRCHPQYALMMPNPSPLLSHLSARCLPHACLAHLLHSPHSQAPFPVPTSVSPVVPTTMRTMSL